jgi:alanine racemase
VSPDEWRGARVVVDAVAIAHNAEVLTRRCAPARLCAVVKAAGYGHGSITAARAALSGGASMLAVALVQEAEELRAAGIDVPILVLSEPEPATMTRAVAAGLDVTVCTDAAIAELERCSAAHAATHIAATHAATHSAATHSSTRPSLLRARVHLKVDTGMHRIGASPGDAPRLAADISSSPHLELAGVWTHCPVADEPSNSFTIAQLDRFDAVLSALRAVGIDPGLVHAANSAATLVHRRSHYSMVRCGIALYGLAPSPALVDRCDELVPALSVVAAVSQVRRIAAGEAVSYGLRYRVTAPSNIATVAIGYADGVSRRLFDTGGQVLINGQRHGIAGVVTMDQLMVDCGDHPVAVGDCAVLLGSQGSETISADEWARRLGTINYEIVCGLSSRLARVAS